jgi:hypothetical protein
MVIRVSGVAGQVPRLVDVCSSKLGKVVRFRGRYESAADQQRAADGGWRCGEASGERDRP